MTTEQASPELFDAATSVEGSVVDEKRSSMLYNVLPVMLQSRIPTLPSIRHALSEMRTPPRSCSPMKGASESPLPRSPPPGYTSRPTSMVGSQCSSDRSTFDSAEEDELFQEATEAPLSSMNTPPQFAISETRTGIKWKYANQGVSLSAQAYAESQLTRLDDTSLVLTRQMYIHSLTYLLRGLPTTLSPEETLSLQAALPPGLVITTPCTHDLSFSNADTAPPANPSVLHRIIATIVFETFVLLQFLLPYLKLFLAHAYRFERKHNVAQRLVSSGIMGADAVRRTGLQLTHSICQMNDGKVGLALSELSLWLARGITGGLQQGIQDGVSMFSEERPRTPGYSRDSKGKRRQ